MSLDRPEISNEQQQSKPYPASHATRLQSAINEASIYLDRWEAGRTDDVRDGMIQSVVDSLNAGIVSVGIEPTDESSPPKKVAPAVEPEPTCGINDCTGKHHPQDHNDAVEPKPSLADEDRFDIMAALERSLVDAKAKRAPAVEPNPSHVLEHGTTEKWPHTGPHVDCLRCKQDHFDALKAVEPEQPTDLSTRGLTKYVTGMDDETLDRLGGLGEPEQPTAVAMECPRCDGAGFVHVGIDGGCPRCNGFGKVVERPISATPLDSTTDPIGDLSYHYLKIAPEHFEDVANGMKRAEVRKHDRDYWAGDILRLKEWVPAPTGFTGREIDVRITHILPGGEYGIDPDYSVLSIEPWGAPTHA